MPEATNPDPRMTEEDIETIDGLGDYQLDRLLDDLHLIDLYRSTLRTGPHVSAIEVGR